MNKNTDQQAIDDILKEPSPKAKKHRGRPKRVIVEGQEPTESGVKTLKDPLMEPYFIKMSQYGYELVEMIQPDLTHSPDSLPYPQNIGYYAKGNFNGCLENIAILKTNSKSYTSLKEYVKEWSKITEELRNITKF